MTIKEIQALQEPVTDPLEQQFREWIGDTPPFMKLKIPQDPSEVEIYHTLPVIEEPLPIPKYQGCSSLFAIILFDAGKNLTTHYKLERSRHWFYAKSAIWAMQSILKNTDALEYQNQIDFAFLVEEHTYPHIHDLFEAAEVPEGNIILGTIEEHEKYIADHICHGSRAKQHILHFSKQLHHYEQVIAQSADTITAKPKNAPQVPIFRHFIGDNAGDLNKPKWPGYVGKELPAQLGAWGTKETVDIRGEDIPRDKFYEKFVEATGIPIERAEKLCDYYATDVEWGAGTSTIVRWPIKHYVDNHPKRVEWMHKWMKEPIIGADNELGMFSVFPYYLQQQEGISLRDCFEPFYIEDFSIEYGSRNTLKHIAVSENPAWFAS